METASDASASHAIFFLMVYWLFSAASNTYIQNDVFCDEVPEEIPHDAEIIRNDEINRAYCYNLMGESISLFVHNGRIYVHYETMNGVEIWQIVEIPHRWNVRKDFQFMRYNWINQDYRDIPQNLQILVFFDRGFLKLTFSSNWDEDENLDKNFVRLEDIAVFPYSSISDACHGQQTMHQYAYDNYILFVSALRCNGEFALIFEKIYFDERFEHGVCKVVLPLSEDVVIEYLRDFLRAQSLFFDHNGNPTETNLVCCLVANISGESYLVELLLDPKSVRQYFDDDGTDGLGLYSRWTDQNYHSFDCVKRSGSDLVGLIRFKDSELDAKRLLGIFPVSKMYAKMYSDAAKRLSSFARMILVRDSTLQMRLEQTQSLTNCSICMEEEPSLFIFSCGHASFCQSCINRMAHNGITICPVCRLQSSSFTNTKDFLPLSRRFFNEE
jgi:hypothetical protein